MIDSIFYAIKHLPTGQFIPTLKHGHSAGGTHVELGENRPPRLFTSELAAKNALKWWLQGQTTRANKKDSETGEEWSVMKKYPRADRRAEEMLVVKVKVNELSE